jgi:transposase
METIINYQEKSKEELIQLLQFSNNFIENTELKFSTELDEKNKTIQQQNLTIQQLLEALRLNRYRLYGAKSEKHNPNQLELDFGIFNEATLPENAPEIIAADEEITIAAYTRKKTVGRKPLPQELPRKQVIYDLSDAEKQCECGHELTRIGEVKTEQLDIVPAKIYVIEHIEKKYACKHCEECVRQAKKPLQPIPKSIASAGLLAHVLTSKFLYHLPLYRQEQQFQRMGVDLARNTLSLWVIRAAALLEPLEKLMLDEIINYDIAYSDESRVQVLKEAGREAQSLSWMWQFCGGATNKFSMIYRYDISRSHEVPLKFFEDFAGFLHCDGHSAYDALAKKNNKIKLSGCLYHARRKFVEANKGNKTKSGVAYQVLDLIQKLAKLEEIIKPLPPDEIKLRRMEKAKPILNKLHALLKEKQPKVPPKSLLGEAIFYMLNQWDKLRVYLEDGRIENNNNRTERGFKAFATGRKNWMFCDSVEGAIAAARIYSFIETCKYHNLDPYYWLAYVLRELPACKTLEELESLLPYNIDKQLLNPINFIPEM